MIAGVTDATLGQLAVGGLLVVGLVLLGRLGWIAIDLAVEAMRHDDRVQYADFDTEPADDTDTLADSLRGNGRHALVPPTTATETTTVIPTVVSGRIPVDDLAAFDAVSSVDCAR